MIDVVEMVAIHGSSIAEVHELTVMRALSTCAKMRRMRNPRIRKEETVREGVVAENAKLRLSKIKDET